MTERIRQMYRAAQDLEQTLGRRPTAEEIASAMEVAADAVRAMMDASQHAIALERPVGDDGDSEFGDFIEDQETISPVDSATQNLLEETIEEVLAELTPRQSHILRLRFGLGGGEPHTLEENRQQVWIEPRAHSAIGEGSAATSAASSAGAQFARLPGVVYNQKLNFRERTKLNQWSALFI